jgi:hypothetical protein
MRGHTDGAKRLQAYLLKAERDNRIHWTMQQLSKSAVLSRSISMLESKGRQINWSNRRKERILREHGMGDFFRTSWIDTEVAHTGKEPKEWRAIGEAAGMKFSHKRRGQYKSALQVIRRELPEAGGSIGIESEMYARGIPLEKARDLATRYFLPAMRELKALGITTQEEVDFARDLEEGI